LKSIVIGSGGAGLAALHALHQAGVAAEAFEQHGELGGVWATTRYPSLTIHSKSFNYRFHDFPPVASRGPSATRAEILAYFAEFAHAKGIADQIVYHRRVDRIVYRPERTADRCRVIATDVRTGEASEHLCDVVVCATGFANAGRPHVPELAGRATSRIRVLHSSELTSEILDDIVAHRRKVAVVGAGKSAHEILWLLRELAPADLVWLYTKSLWALSYEVLYRESILPTNVLWYLYYLRLSALRRRIGFGTVMKVLQAPLRWSGLFVNPLEPHSDVCVNRAAIMKRDQYTFLKTVRSLKAQVTGLAEHAVRLATGDEVEVDYLICATGYDRSIGLPEIAIEAADGTTTAHALADQHGFYHQMIDPAVPGISVLAANVLYPQQLVGYSLGAQWLARFHAGQLARPPSEREMARSMTADASRFAAWVSGDYLSNGLPYAHQRNEDVLPRLFAQMGLAPGLARALVRSGANEAKFGTLCDVVAAQLVRPGRGR
jgi:cation diffusion facilitator CzcD-associated flavoprotein CzcO